MLELPAPADDVGAASFAPPHAVRPIARSASETVPRDWRMQRGYRRYRSLVHNRGPAARSADAR